MTEQENQPGQPAPTANDELTSESVDHQASDGPEAADNQPVAELQAELAQARQQLDEIREQMLRAAAEAQNIRRRAERDVENAHKFGLEKLIGELLPVVDNLERALESANRDDPDNQAFLQGIELTRKSFLDALKKHAVEPVDPFGEPFDPQLHQAMSMVESAEAEPNTVIGVMLKGYTLSGRLIRPAMVMVSKAPAGQAGTIDEQA